MGYNEKELIGSTESTIRIRKNTSLSFVCLALEIPVSLPPGCLGKALQFLWRLVGGRCQAASCNRNGPVAQWLEQVTHNYSVAGSIPAGVTNTNDKRFS